VLLHAASGGRRSAKEAGGKSDEVIGVTEYDLEVRRIGVSRGDRDLDGGCRLARLASRDGDGACLVRPRDSPRRLGGVEHRALERL
jgi:hypothetical protein